MKNLTIEQPTITVDKEDLIKDIKKVFKYTARNTKFENALYIIQAIDDSFKKSFNEGVPL